MTKIQTPNSNLPRLAAAVAMMLAVAAACGAGAGLSVRLKGQATVSSATVTLGDIADVSGAQAGAYASLAVAQVDRIGDTTAIKLAEINRRLVDQGANQAYLTLSGFAICRVTRVAPPEPLDLPAAAPPPREGAGSNMPQAQANPDQPVDIAAGPGTPAARGLVSAAGEGTLRELVMRKVEAIAGVDRSQLQVTFSAADGRALGAAVGSDAIEVKPQTTIVPGRVPFAIRRYGGASVSQTISVTADVARLVKAVVATRQICHGETFTQDALAVKPVAMSTPGTPVTDIGGIVGQVCRSTVAPGTVILADIVQPPLMIKRGDLVTVRCVAGNVVVTTVARAQQDGAMGEVIRATNQKSRESFDMRVTGDRQGLMLASAPAPAPRISPGSGPGISPGISSGSVATAGVGGPVVSAAK